MAATLMEKERLLNLIAYAESIVLLRVAPTDLRDQLTRFLGEQRSRIFAAAPEAIKHQCNCPRHPKHRRTIQKPSRFIQCPSATPVQRAQTITQRSKAA